MLLDGVEIPLNKEQAAIYLKKAADQGNEEALLKYSQMLIKEKDKKETSIYLRMLADQRNAEAMYEYGLILLSSNDNFLAAKAEEYFKQSAALGNPKSMCEYGKIICMKYENKENVIKGADYLKRSAYLGNDEEMGLYGSISYHMMGRALKVIKKKH